MPSPLHLRRILTGSCLLCALWIIVGCRQELPSQPRETPDASVRDASVPESPVESSKPREPAAAPATTPQPAESQPAEPPRKLPTDAGMDTAVESPDVGDGLYDEEYEIDPEIQAHIDAHRRALRRIADRYQAPPGAKQIGKQADLWVDLKTKRVYVDGYVAMQRGPLEMFACPVGSKEHESVIALFAKSSEVHAALLAVGATSGTPVRWDPEFAPPTGQTIAVWILYRPHEPVAEPEVGGSDKTSASDDQEEAEQEFNPSDDFRVVDARSWVRDVETQTELKEPWVFAGSMFWTDPEDGTEHYSADAGDMICVSNFASAMLDVPFKSSAEAGSLMFEPFSERVPDRGTPVRLVLVPQPAPGENTAAKLPLDPTTPPDETMLQIAEPSNL